MASINYKSEVEGFNEDLRLNNYSFMPIKDDEFGICKKLSETKAQAYFGKKVKEEEFKPHFIKTISILGEKTLEFYLKKGESIGIKRYSDINNGESIIEGNNMSQRILLTSRPLRQVDLVAYCHEFGHLPTILHPHKNEYYEFSEVFPMFLEYLADYQIEPESIKEIMTKIRLEPTKEMATNFLRNQRGIKNNNSYKDKYLRLDQRENMKYIRSLEFVLQLLKIYKSDRKAVIEELEKYVQSEKSMKEIGKTFGIKTEGCQNVLRLKSK